MWVHFVTAICLVFVFLMPTARLSAQFSIPDGDYTGWAYDPGGGDFPLRLRSVTVNEKIELSVVFPHLKFFEMKPETVREEDDTVTLECRNSRNQLWKFEIQLSEDSLKGEASVDGGEVEFTFNLIKTSQSLNHSPLKNPEQYTGVYKSETGDTLIVSQWSWGELKCTNTGNGRVGTLFQASDGSFFLGPALYLATSVRSRISFCHGETDTVDSMTMTHTNGEPESLIRFIPDEKQVSFSSGDNTLAGTLIAPASDGPHPAMVMLGGSDWSVRKDVQAKAEIFASMGIAVLIYDKRGNGESTGDPVCSFEESATDAVAGWNFLKKLDKIDPSRIGVYGASRGGWVAPMVANRAEGIAFVILFVAPAVSPAQQEHTRRMNEIKANEFDANEIKAADDYLNTLWKATASDEDWDRYVKLRDEVVGHNWYKFADGIQSKNSDDYHWAKLNMQHDPIPELRRLKTPVLGLFGEYDTNVTPAENLPRFQNALQRAGNNNFTLRVIPNANHGLQYVEEPHSQTPFHLTIGYSHDVWTTVRDWLRSEQIIPSSSR